VPARPSWKSGGRARVAPYASPPWPSRNRTSCNAGWRRRRGGRRPVYGRVRCALPSGGGEGGDGLLRGTLPADGVRARRARLAGLRVLRRPGEPWCQRARPRDGGETARRVAAKTTPDKASSRCDMVGRASGGCITAPVRADDRRILPEAPDRAVDSEERLPDDLRNGEDARWAGLLPPVEQHSEAPD